MFAVTAGPRGVRAENRPASAQAPAARSPDEASRAAAAIDELQREYQATGNPEVLFKLAETYRQAGNATAAARTYEAYIRRAPRGPHRAAAERQLRELDTADDAAPPAVPAAAAKPAAPAPAPAPPRVVKPAAPAAAPRAAAPADVPLPPSESAPLSAAGTESPSKVPSADAASRPAGSSSAGATLSTDGGPAGTAGPTTPLPAWLPLTAAGATIALTVGAILAGTWASSRYNELHGSCAQTVEGCTAAQIDDVRSRARTANLLWAAAGVAAAATGVTVFINTREAGMSALWRF